MRKSFLTFSIVLISHFLFGQELTIDETITYINNLISEKGKISLKKDGTLEYFNSNNSKSLYQINNSHQSTYKVHISEIKVYDNVEEPREMFGKMNTWHIYVSCKEQKPYGRDTYVSTECMKLTYPNDTKKNVASFDLYTNDEDKSTTIKLLNSFSYLISKCEEKGYFNRVDDDPFSSNNYNPKASDISGDNKSEAIKLEKENGVYYIIISIGSITRKFILDTGASDVLISNEMESKLIAANVIKKTDYLTPALYRIADGSIVKCRRLILPELKIGNFKIKNVKASVGINDTPLLLGKSLLDKFRKWTIDNLAETLNVEK